LAEFNVWVHRSTNSVTFRTAFIQAADIRSVLSEIFRFIMKL